MKICYWTIAYGEYAYMAQALIDSFNRHEIHGDFLCYSNLELKNCINKSIDKDISLDLNSYLFKFLYLNKLKDFDYDYFIFLDCDSFFVRKPEIGISYIIEDGVPWHSFLESPINSYKTLRRDWWGVEVNDLTTFYRELGVNHEEIRNTNAGFWICKKDFIDEAINLGMKCYNYISNKGYKITEEIPIAYISNIVSKKVEKRFHDYYFNYWASDWTGAFRNIIPYNKAWEYESYMTTEKYIIQPALIHAMRSKRALIDLGKNILTQS